MSFRVTTSEVEAIAALARIELDGPEVELFARQLGDILGYARELQAVNTSDVAPTAHVAGSQDTERPDEIRPSLDRTSALQNAPDAWSEGGLFKVPRVLG
jgi:aspartyl-tRNA(Asn)/glutamyl-tRNA(Gln) amidotransferase subunit C